MRNLLFLLLLVPALASAQTTAAARSFSKLGPTPPPPVEAPEPVREIIVPKGAVTTLHTKLRFTSMIVLPEGDDILDVVCGDDTFWQIKPTGHIAHIKPSKEGATTNLNLVAASGTIYSFILTEGKTEGPPDTLVLYVNRHQNEQVATGKTVTPKYYPASALIDLQNELKAAQEERLAVQKEADLRIAIAVQDYPTRMRFAYARLPNQPPFNISSIWHDGQMTYIKTSARELPVIYEVLDGKPAFVNYEVPKPDTYVVKKVLDRGYFQLGKQKLSFRAVQ